MKNQDIQRDLLHARSLISCALHGDEELRHGQLRVIEDAIFGAIDALKSAQADTERLDWLDGNGYIPTESNPFTNTAHVTRSSIDAARKR